MNAVETCWADALTRQERAELARKLARACRIFAASARVAARWPLHRDASPESLNATSNEMADLHLDVTERAEVAPR